MPAAEVKKPIKALGERITGLRAGTKYVFVLPKPKAKLDNAKSAAKLATEIVEQVGAIAKQLAAAKKSVGRGDFKGAETAVKAAKAAYDALGQKLKEAKLYAESAADDAGSAIEDLKNAFDLGKKAAQAALKHAEGLYKALADTIRAVGAQIEEAKGRA